MYSPKFIIPKHSPKISSVIIYICLQHSVCEYKIAVFLFLRERICSLKNFEFAPKIICYLKNFL